MVQTAAVSTSGPAAEVPEGAAPRLLSKEADKLACPPVKPQASPLRSLTTEQEDLLCRVLGSNGFAAGAKTLADSKISNEDRKAVIGILGQLAAKKITHEELNSQFKTRLGRTVGGDYEGSYVLENYTASEASRLSELEPLLQHESPEVRSAAVRVAAKSSIPAAPERLRKVLTSDKDIGVRAEAVYGLGELKDAASIALFKKAAEDNRNNDLGLRAVQALAKFKDKGLAEYLHQAAVDPRNSTRLRSSALGGFCDLAEPGARIKTAAELFSAKHEDPELRLASFNVLFQNDDPQLFKRCQGILQPGTAEDPAMRKWAAVALIDLVEQKMKKGASTDAEQKLILSSLSCEKDPQVLKELFQSMLRYRDETPQKLTDAAIQVLRSGNAAAKAEAAFALSCIRNKSACAALEETLALRPDPNKPEEAQEFVRVWDHSISALQQAPAHADFLAKASRAFAELVRDTKDPVAVMNGLEVFGHLLSGAISRHGDDVKGQIDRAFREGLGLGRNAPITAEEALTRVIGNSKQWMTESSLKSSYNKTPFDDLSWKAAITNLWNLFLVEAAPRNSSAAALSKPAISRILSDAETLLAGRKAPLESRQEMTERVRNTLSQLDVGGDALKRAQAFLDRVETTSPPGGPHNAAEPYARAFSCTMLRKLREQPDLDPKEAEKIGRLVTRLEDKISADLGKFRTHDNVPGSAGSLLNTYELSVLALAVPRGKMPEQLHSVMRTAAEHPLYIPYNMNGSSGDNSPLGSAARAVPFHLALYQHAETGQEQAKALENVRQAFLNYAENRAYLIAAVKEEQTHNPAFASIAPYYFYPTVPYAAEAAALLQESKLLTKAQKDEVAKAQQLLCNDLIHQLESSGVFAPQLGSGYENSPGYVNPLAGLALLSFLRKQPGGGILARSPAQ